MKTDTIKHSFSGRLFKSTTCIFGLCLLMFVGAMPLSAQVYSTAQQGNRYGAQEDIQQSYNSYQSTVYQPFVTTSPSSNYKQVSSSSAFSGGYAPMGRRNSPTGGDNSNVIGGTVTTPNDPAGETGAPDGFLTPDDPGHKSEQSPVGEAWVMLFFAAVAALVVYIRRRRFSLEDTPETPQR